MSLILLSISVPFLARDITHTKVTGSRVRLVGLDPCLIQSLFPISGYHNFKRLLFEAGAVNRDRLSSFRPADTAVLSRRTLRPRHS